MYDLIIIGGGAAGVFASIAAKTARPRASVLLLEKSASLLSKVRLTGGGRCNLTNACFDPRLLTQFYPRGGKELIGPFHQFQPKDTMEWFEARGVALKVERGGRVFPLSDQSETVVQCLISNSSKAGVDIALGQEIEAIVKRESWFEITVKGSPPFAGRSLLLATGSSADGYRWARSLGHTIVPPVPSLFSFAVPASPLRCLSGISVDPVVIHIIGSRLKEHGPLLITHTGFSGPCVLKLSAWGARQLHQTGYRAEISINWLPSMSYDDIYHQLLLFKKQSPQKTLISETLFDLPKGLWKRLLELHTELSGRRIHDISLRNLARLSHQLHDDRYIVDGRGPSTDEFVTCGGVSLRDIHFKTMESKICPSLFFAGEILDIDGLTGGFNLQNAWTTGYIAGRSSLSFTDKESE